MVRVFIDRIDVRANRPAPPPPVVSEPPPRPGPDLEAYLEDGAGR